MRCRSSERLPDRLTPPSAVRVTARSTLVPDKREAYGPPSCRATSPVPFLRDGSGIQAQPTSFRTLRGGRDRVGDPLPDCNQCTGQMLGRLWKCRHQVGCAQVGIADGLGRSVVELN